MNNKILDKVDEIVTLVKESNEYKDYLFLKEKLSKHEKANTLIKEIKTIQKELVKLETKGNDTSELLEEYNSKKEELTKIPLYTDYINTVDKLNDMYKLIKERLDNYFDSKLN